MIDILATEPKEFRMPMSKTGSPCRPTLREVREERSRDCLDAWLRTNTKHKSIKWSQYEPEGPQRAPDWFVTLDGKQFAVEITSISHQKKTGGKVFTDERVWASQKKTIAAVEEKCRKEGVLTGIYYVKFIDIVANRPKMSNNVTQMLFDYVKKTQPVYQASKQTIAPNGVDVCTIEKTAIHETGDGIYYSSSISKDVEAGSVPLCDVVRESVNKKAKKLAKVSEPVILLLDENGYHEPPHEWLSCLDNLPSTSSFHSIIVARNGSRGPAFAVRVGEDNWPVLHANSDMPC